jgi:Ca-activated chloride channel family protein
MFSTKHKKKYILFSSMLVLAILVGTSFLTAFPTIPKPTGSSDGSLRWDLKLANPYLLQGTNDELVLNLNITGEEYTVKERPPVNLVLVLDRSGSMSERGKLEYAKKAANEIISSLSSNDRLGIVAYSTNVELLFPIQILEDKRIARNVVNSLYPTNSTNLSGGLIKGINQIESVLNKEYLNRVVLLSDGLANAGITNISQINKISRRASEMGIGITTMGLGANYDETMLTSIAEYGAGNYYFIESPTQIASIFNKEFGQLVRTVAKNPRIKLHLEPGVKIKDVSGYKYFEKDGNIEINPGDLFGGQERNILIRLDVPTNQVGSNKLAKAFLEFDDIANRKSVTYSEELDYKVTKKKGLVLKNENKEVGARAASVQAASEFYRAARLYEDGKLDEAMAEVTFGILGLDKLNSSPQRSAETVEQEMVLRGALKDMSNNAPAPSSEAGKSIIKKYKAQSRLQQK